MREIKFRVWSKKDKNFLHNTEINSDLIHADGKWYFLGGNELNEKYIVQQFTGLKDSKGNEVWEGDIIKYTRLIEKERRIVELFSFIKFQDAKFGFDLTGFNDMFYDLSDEPDFEVVGNIFENSELLKE